jgi:hypothetical protein
MTLLEKLDRLVYATHLDRIVFMKMAPRTFRWTPLLVLAAMVVGYALMATTPTVLERGFWIGWLTFYGAVLVASFVRIFGPRFTPTMAHPLDERELMVKARAHAASGHVFATFAMLGCFYMASAPVPWLWHPSTLQDWINLGFGLQACSLLLPTLMASWMEPRVEDDLED